MHFRIFNEPGQNWGFTCDSPSCDGDWVTTGYDLFALGHICVYANIMQCECLRVNVEIVHMYMYYGVQYTTCILMEQVRQGTWFCTSLHGESA